MGKEWDYWAARRADFTYAKLGAFSKAARSAAKEMFAGEKLTYVETRNGEYYIFPVAGGFSLVSPGWGYAPQPKVFETVEDCLADLKAEGYYKFHFEAELV